MTTRLSRRLLAFHLAIATLVFVSYVPVAQAGGATLSGRVLETDGVTPRNGVVVALVDADNRLVYRSAATGEDGAFRIDSAPEGGYKLLAETDGGAFLAGDDFQLASGDNRPLALKLTPAAQMSNATIAPGQADAGSTWWQWMIAGSIAVAGLLVVSDAGSSDEPVSSPSEVK